MADRYTSPDLSRLLAEAGLEQKIDGLFYCEDMGLVRLTRTDRVREEWNAEDASARYSFDDRIRQHYYVRALDLTDVLRELTRPRPEEADARPLCEDYTLATFGDVKKHRFTAYGRYIDDSRAVTIETRDSDAEAAAACLLALLLGRAK